MELIHVEGKGETPFLQGEHSYFGNAGNKRNASAPLASFSLQKVKYFGLDSEVFRFPRSYVTKAKQFFI